MSMKDVVERSFQNTLIDKFINDSASVFDNKDGSQKDAESKCANGSATNPPAYVNGQTIHNLFAGTGQKTQDILYSNGGETLRGPNCKKVVETKGRKVSHRAAMDREGYVPSHMFVSAVHISFQKRTKKHFFVQGYFLCRVFAKEMGIPFSEFLRVRCWKAKRVDDELKISYVRLSQAIPEKNKAGYNRSMTMIERLYELLSSDDLIPSTSVSSAEKAVGQKSGGNSDQTKPKADQPGIKVLPKGVRMA